MSFENLKNNKLKVAIVGAGPAGAITAYLLASQGLCVTIFERRKEVERKVCGEYLCPEGVKLLDKLNLTNQLCAGFDELHGMVLNSPTGIVVPSYFPQLGASGEEVVRGLSLNRQVFDQKILNLAIENGAKLLSDVTVTQVSINHSGQWIVTGNDQDYEFDFLVAADGRQSKVGHLLGHIKAINTKRAAIHCYLPRKIDRGQRLGEMHILFNNQYCGLDPISDDEVNFSIVCDSELLKKETPVTIINNAIKGSLRLSAMFDLISEDKKVEIKIVTTLKNRNKFIAGNNLAYVGDAAGFIDPLTGEGIYNALLSGFLLTEEMSKTTDLNKALSNYKKEKRKLSFQKSMLNNFFQFLIKSPFLVYLTALYLKRSQKRADHFIGIIGNVHSPIVGIARMLKN